MKLMSVFHKLKILLNYHIRRLKPHCIQIFHRPVIRNPLISLLLRKYSQGEKLSPKLKMIPSKESNQK